MNNITSLVSFWHQKSCRKRIITVITVLLCVVVFTLPASMTALPGDMDGDGVITPADARIVLRISVGLEKIEDYMTDKPSGNDKEATNNTISSVKVGFICLHDENSTYDLNFINGAKTACEQLGIPEKNCYIKTNIPEGQECYNAAVDLVRAGCSVVFANSFGHEDFMIEAAKAYPNVHFCHCTGTKAHTEKLANYHNAYAAICEGRFLTGIAAGMKLTEMIDTGKIGEDQAKIGYVGAFTYAEVVSDYTAFFLGARYICPTVTMEVTFTGAWYDESAEREAAYQLINDGCVLLSQHSDSMGAPTACELKGVPNVAYNGSTLAACPNTYLVASRIDWTPYFVYAVTAAAEGKGIDTDWTGTLATGSVQLTKVNERVAAAGTQEKIDQLRDELESGRFHVFDVSTFTKDGVMLSSYLADVDTDAAYEPDTEAVIDGYFHESEFRSAPYFDIQIDGITLNNTAF